MQGHSRGLEWVQYAEQQLISHPTPGTGSLTCHKFHVTSLQRSSMGKISFSLSFLRYVLKSCLKHIEGHDGLDWAPNAWIPYLWPYSDIRINMRRRSAASQCPYHCQYIERFRKPVFSQQWNSSPEQRETMCPLTSMQSAMQRMFSTIYALSKYSCSLSFPCGWHFPR